MQCTFLQFCIKTEGLPVETRYKYWLTVLQRACEN